MTLYVDYRNLGVEELGTVYESLLDYRLRINDTGSSLSVKDATSERVVGSGLAYLAPMSTERGDLASYYTPPALVSLVLDRSLDILLEERLTAAGSDLDARAAAILDLRIIDPACGSGAFLAEALERLAVALARERSVPSEPSDYEVAAARRDILSRCIYGADKDPFAVELCKVALWIHCAVPDAPLSFLDHHIVCGDSLVGWPMFGIPDTIPSEAFEFGKADAEDKKILKAARSENKEFLTGVQTLWAEPVQPVQGLSLPSLLERPDLTHDDVRAKASAYASYKASSSYQERRMSADIWTSAFFWTYRHGSAPTTRQYRSSLAGRPEDPIASESSEIVAPLNPLHWALEFPDIRDRGGFDAVIGNPPWEQYKGEEIEFFAEAAPSIAALPSKPRKVAINALVETDPALYDRWCDYRAGQNRLAHYAKTCGRFERTRSETNTYLLFAQLAADLTAERGRVGILVKSGIALDAAQSAVWSYLIDAGRVAELRDMVNAGQGGTSPIFPSVAAVERFSVLVLRPPQESTEFGASTMSMGLEEAIAKDLTPWSRDRLKTVCPSTGTLLSARRQWEVDLATRLQASHLTLDYDQRSSTEPENPWEIVSTGLFHSSGAQSLFLRREELEEDGWLMQPDRTFRHPDGRLALALFEGQMLNRWDHRARTYEGYSGEKKYGRKPHIPWVTDAQHSDAAFEVEPRYWMLDTTAEERLDETMGDRAIIGFRDVGAPWTNQRSIKAALLYRTPATDTLPFIGVARERVLLLLALINSTTFDFLARVHAPGTHLKSWVLSQCAAPVCDDMDPACETLAARLSSSSSKLARAYGLELHPWDPDERRLMEAECDARVALSYGVHRDEYDRLFDHFEVMGRVEISSVGEYRTKRLCLEAYDRLEGGT